MSALLRFGVSLVAAIVIVGALTVVGVSRYMAREPVHQVEAFRVEPATAAELEQVQAMPPAEPASGGAPPD